MTGTDTNRFAATKKTAVHNTKPPPGIQGIKANGSQRSRAAAEITGSTAVAIEAMKDFRVTGKSGKRLPGMAHDMAVSPAVRGVRHDSAPAG